MPLPELYKPSESIQTQEERQLRCKQFKLMFCILALFLSVNSWSQWMWINTSVPGNHVSHKRKFCFDSVYLTWIFFSAWLLNQHAASGEYASVLLVKKDEVKKTSDRCTDQCKDVSDLKTGRGKLNGLPIKRIIWSQPFLKSSFKCVQLILVKL